MNLHSYTNMTPTSITGTQMFHPDWEERVRWALADMGSSSDQVLRLYAHTYIHPPHPLTYTHTHRLTRAVTALRAVTVKSGRRGKFPLTRTLHYMQWTPWHLTLP